MDSLDKLLVVIVLLSAIFTAFMLGRVYQDGNADYTMTQAQVNALHTCKINK